MQPKDQIVFALDVSDLDRLLWLTQNLQDHVGFFKVGLEAWAAFGPAVLEEIEHAAPRARVMLDLKLHDIPATVERTVEVVKQHDCVKLLTAHVGDATGAYSQAIENAIGYVDMVGITVLTSVNDVSAGLLIQRFERAQATGFRYVVCSALDLEILTMSSSGMKFITPGIRLLGEDVQDHARAATPLTAIQSGADLIVVGRSIRDAKDPVYMAGVIAEQIAYAHETMRYE